MRQEMDEPGRDSPGSSPTIEYERFFHEARGTSCTGRWTLQLSVRRSEHERVVPFRPTETMFPAASRTRHRSAPIQRIIASKGDLRMRGNGNIFTA